MTVLFVAPRADRDVDGILEHLAAVGGERTAANYESRFDALFIKLIDFPALGRHIRSGFVDPYIVFYRFLSREDRLEILRILHGYRHIDRRHFMPVRGST